MKYSAHIFVLILLNYVISFLSAFFASEEDVAPMAPKKRGRTLERANQFTPIQLSRVIKAADLEQLLIGIIRNNPGQVNDDFFNDRLMSIVNYVPMSISFNCNLYDAVAKFGNIKYMALLLKYETKMKEYTNAILLFKDYLSWDDFKQLYESEENQNKKVIMAIFIFSLFHIDPIFANHNNTVSSIDRFKQYWQDLPLQAKDLVPFFLDNSRAVFENANENLSRDFLKLFEFILIKTIEKNDINLTKHCKFAFQYSMKEILQKYQIMHEDPNFRLRMKTFYLCLLKLNLKLPRDLRNYLKETTARLESVDLLRKSE